MNTINEMMNEIYKMFEGKTDIEIRRYIEQIMEYLDKETPIKGIQGFYVENGRYQHGLLYSGYINSDSPIRTAIYMSPFHLDSSEPYLFILKELCHYDYDSFALLVSIADLKMNEYFDGDGPQISRDDVYSKKGKISIQDFKGKTAAKCSEKSALMQNLFSMIGINSHLVVGELKVNNDSHDDSHAYLILEQDDELFLYDPQNPIIIWSEDKTSQIPMGAALISLGKNISLEELETVSFDYSQVLNPLDIDIVQNQPKREYHLPKSLNKKGKNI